MMSGIVKFEYNPDLLVIDAGQYSLYWPPFVDPVSSHTELTRGEFKRTVTQGKIFGYMNPKSFLNPEEETICFRVVEVRSRLTRKGGSKMNGVRLVVSLEGLRKEEFRKLAYEGKCRVSILAQVINPSTGSCIKVERVIGFYVQSVPGPLAYFSPDPVVEFVKETKVERQPVITKEEHDRECARLSAIIDNHISDSAWLLEQMGIANSTGNERPTHYQFRNVNLSLNRKLILEKLKELKSHE